MLSRMFSHEESSLLKRAARSERNAGRSGGVRGSVDGPESEAAAEVDEEYGSEAVDVEANNKGRNSAGPTGRLRGDQISDLTHHLKPR